MTRAASIVAILLCLAPAVGRADALADKAKAALEAERRVAHATDAASKERAQRDARRLDSEARAAAHEELRATDRRAGTIDRSERRDVRIVGGREVTRERARGLSGRENDVRSQERDRTERERERERREDRDDDRSEGSSKDDGSEGSGDDHHGGEPGD